MWEDVRFDGTFRDYQQRILDESDRYLRQGRLHIVAPPGSGKTILGLELVRRAGAAALVFSPTVAIAGQWIDRFTTHFTGGAHTASQQLRQPADLTSVTYQALFAAIDEREPEEQSPQGEESDGDADAANTGADRSSMPDSEQSARDGVFPADAPDADAPSSAEDAVSRRAQALAELVDMVVDAGIRTICLDEAHHLRREWQRAIEDFTDALRSDDRVSGRIVTIALTATPPYDANPAEWERYERLCGPIDEEIFTPELVAQRNLCPHQDYVMFNYPTAQETAAIMQRRVKAADALEQIVADPLFDEAIAAAGVALEGESCTVSEAIYDHPDGYLALMALMNATGRHPARRLIRLVSANGRLPACRAPQAEAALQFVIATPDVFGKQLSARMKMRLSRLGVVEHGKVVFDNDDEAARRLMSPVGKLDSITRIVRHESAAIGERLRLLVLTDYIRKELKPDIGGERPMTTMGVIPIFETLRRAFAADHAAVDGSSAPNGAPVARMGAISGGLVVIPADLRDETAAIASRRGVTARFKPLPVSEYLEADLGPANDVKTAVVTELFESGRLHVLIGTKSLLGEGWDSPSINTLVLASVVGSFMLTNQMRGRAIRTVAADPDKVANIWHLVAVEPPPQPGNAAMRMADAILDPPDYSTIRGEDYARLCRRFDCFMGPSYAGNAIESGIRRIGIIQPPFDREGIERINGQMLERSARRAEVAAQWFEAGDRTGGRTVRTVRVGSEVQPRGVLFVNILETLIYVIASGVIGTVARMLVLSGDVVPGAIVGALLIAVIPLAVRAIMRAVSVSTPTSTVTALADALLRTLRELRLIDSPRAAVIVEECGDGGGALQCMLADATQRDQALFSRMLQELLAPIDNPRFVLIGKRWGRPAYGVSFPCPASLARRKSDVECLTRHLRAGLRRYEPVYTRSEQGRRVLLMCRRRSFLNRATVCMGVTDAVVGA